MVPGVILAAGRSRRMGRSKPLLHVAAGGATFVAHLTSALVEGGVADALVVGRADDEALRREVEALGTAVRFVVNAQADRGQLSSVIAGLNAADRPGTTGVLVMPVDAPLIRASTIRTLLAVFAERHPPIVRATYHERHGHPVIFGRAVFNELRCADPGVGAKAVVQSHAADRIDLEIDDPAIVQDIDGPDDYTRLVGGR